MDALMPCIFGLARKSISVMNAWSNLEDWLIHATFNIKQNGSEKISKIRKSSNFEMIESKSQDKKKTKSKNGNFDRPRTITAKLSFPQGGFLYIRQSCKDGAQGWSRYSPRLCSTSCPSPRYLPSSPSNLRECQSSNGSQSACPANSILEK